MDDGPNGVAATVAQPEEVPGYNHSVYRLINYTSRVKTKAEKAYGKTEAESLGVYSGILSNSMYLYGTTFTVVVDHELLVLMYNSHSRTNPVRVAKHRSKLRSFDFKLRYKPGATNLSDYGSRHPPPLEEHSREDKIKYGIDEEEEDSKIVIA